MKNLTNYKLSWNKLIPCGLIISLMALTAFTQMNHEPETRLGTLAGGKISVEDFKAHDGLNVVITTKDKVMECEITNFSLVRVATKQDPVEVNQYSAKFNERSKALVEKATVGDIYYVDNVKAKCPGDIEAKKVNSLVFKIK